MYLLLFGNDLIIILLLYHYVLGHSPEYHKDFAWPSLMEQSFFRGGSCNQRQHFVSRFCTMLMSCRFLIPDY